jgi:hypothetical protein
MSLYDEIAADLAQLLTEFGKPVTINGDAHVALVSEPQADVTVEEGGLNFDSKFTAKVARSAFTTLPQTGQPFIYNGITHTVQTVVDRPPHPIIILEVVA